MSQKNNNILDYTLNQQSLDYLNLNKQPFSHDILTEKSCFQIQAVEKIIDSLIHQVQFSDLFLLVEGDHGAGKTTIYRRFIQSDIANTKLLSMYAEATDTLVQIQQKISLHLEDLGHANYLEDNLKSLQNFDQKPLLIIDNSHVLSDTTLQELFRYQQNLAKEHDVNLKILFFANTGMRETLQKITDIQNTQMYAQKIPELTSKQCENFIMHRLHNAGYSDGPRLDHKAFQQFFNNCHGTPFDIMCQTATFFDKTIADIISPKTHDKNKIMIASSLAFLVISLAFTAYYFTLNQEKEYIPAEITEQASSITHNDNITTTPDSIPEQTAETIRQNLPAITQQNNIKANEETLSSLSNETETETEQDTASQPLTAEVADRPVSQNNSVPLESEKTLPASTPETKPEIKPDIKLEKTKQETVVAIQKKAPSQDPQMPVDSIESHLPPALIQLDKLGLHNASWINQQNNKNWTFQLLGARGPETLLKFAQRNQLSAPAAWYKTQLKSRDYYVIVYGSYNSRTAAADAIKALPTSLQSLKPWIKSIKSVKKALK